MDARDRTLKQLGLTLRQARESAGLSQEMLAERADLDITYISGIERGRRNPSLISLLLLAQGLGVPVAKLLKGLAL